MLGKNRWFWFPFLITYLELGGTGPKLRMASSRTRWELTLSFEVECNRNCIWFQSGKKMRTRSNCLQKFGFDSNSKAFGFLWFKVYNSMVFFLVCFVFFVLCACSSSKAHGICFFFFFKAYAPNKTQERASKLISFSVSLFLDCVCLLVFFMAWLCSFASAFSDLKQIDFLFSLW